MEVVMPNITLEEGLDLREVQTTGSLLHINEIYDDTDGFEIGPTDNKVLDALGEPVRNFKELEEKMTTVDSNGYVKKIILEEGGGLPLDEDCTVFMAFSAYWENEEEPFDVMTERKPLEVNFKDNGVLPGLEMALKSMLVGELSIFLFSHQVMYGELGIPPRIKPASQCIFYIKLVKSILTPKEGKLILSEPNMFQRVHKEVKMLYSSGAVLYKSNNFPLAINLFKKAVSMLHKCRLADEEEEKIQEKLLKKLYINLAVCYNKTKQPLKTCVACNELNRLNNLWNNGKALFQNAKALRMIGQYDCAEKRLIRAMKLSPGSKDMKAEMELLKSTRDSCNQTRLINKKIFGSGKDIISDNFKQEVDNLIKNFKENINLCKLTLPASLNSDEMDYVKEACIRENLFFNRIPRSYPLDNDEEKGSSSKSAESLDHNFVLDKEKLQICSDLNTEKSELINEELFENESDLSALD